MGGNNEVVIEDKKKGTNYLYYFFNKQLCCHFCWLRFFVVVIFTIINIHKIKTQHSIIKMNDLKDNDKSWLHDILFCYFKIVHMNKNQSLMNKDITFTANEPLSVKKLSILSNKLKKKKNH